jgi:hypothetical protein
VRVLGAGATGEVHEVEDLRTGERLALKVLRRPRSAWLVGFKREFRALADLRHPHLVAYHGLWREGRDWLLLMDLVDGVELGMRLTGAASAGETGGSAATLALADDSTDPDPDPSGDGPLRDPRPVAQPLPLDEVLTLARGLAAGLMALHAAGYIHRDLKPGNIIVRPDGSPVLLDFGLVAPEADLGRLVVGTPRYMAPEALRPPMGPPADWYAFGLILHEALTGRLPQEGSGISLIQRRAQRGPSVRAAAPDLPPPLAELVDALLHPDPARRPTGPDVARALGGVPPAAARPPFVGREADLARLSEHLHGRGAPVLRVWGEPGVGKSALIAHALRSLQADTADALVLAGRCHAAEALPYKALDELIDAAALWLTDQPDAVQLAPGEAAALAAAFPALADLAPKGPAPAPAPLAAALVSLVRALAAPGRRVVLVIEDVQWGDADSAWLLAALREAAVPARLLLAHRGPLERLPPAMAEALAGTPGLQLGPLDAADAAALAAALGAQDRAAEIVSGSAGHPYLLAELARGPARGGLQEVLRARLAALDPGLRELVQLVAAQGGSLPEPVLQRACPRLPLRRLVSAAMAASLLRTAQVEPERAFDTFHDRVREVLIDGLPDQDRSALHRRLALAWGPDGPPEALARHWDLAGEPALALPALRAAAERATRQGAHAHAADLLRRVMQLDPSPPVARAIAAALAASGQRAEAASRLEALVTPGPRGHADLAAAAEHHLRSGHPEAGLRLLRRLARERGLPWSRHWLLTIAQIVWQRTRLGLRGYAFELNDQVPDEQLQTLAANAAFNRSLRFTDAFQGVAFGARWVLGALSAGHAGHLAQALANELNTLAAPGGAPNPTRVALRVQVEALAARLDQPAERAAVLLDLAGADALEGRFSDTLARVRAADALLAPLGDAAQALADVRLTYLSMAAWFAGDWGWLEQEGRTGRVDARRRGDRWVRGWLDTGHMLVIRAAFGESPDALRAAQADLGFGPEVPVLYTTRVLGLCELDLLQGRPALAGSRLADAAGVVRSSMLRQAQVFRVVYDELRLRVALQLPGRRREAAALVRSLGAEGVPWAQALAAIGALGLRAQAGEPWRGAPLDHARRLARAAGLHAHDSALAELADPDAPGGPASPAPPGVDLARRRRLLLPWAPAA